MVVRDSLSKCDYSNPFDVKNYSHHNASSSSHVSKSFTKDVLEISEDKIKKEAMIHIDSAASRIPSGLYVVVSRVGKYTFLALAIPPYFVLYMMPRWLLMTAIPEGLKAAFQPMIRLLKMIQQAMKVTVHAVWHPVIHFFHRMAVKIKQIRQKLKGFTKRFSAATAKKVGVMFGPIRAAFNRLVAVLAQLKAFSPLSQIKQWGRAIAQGMASLFQGFSTGFTTRLQKAMRKATNGRKWILSKGGPILARLTAVFQSSSEIANRMLAWIGERISVSFRVIVNLKHFKKIKITVQSILQSCKGVLNKLAKSMRRQMIKLKNKVIDLAKPYKRWAKAFRNYSQSFFQQGQAFAKAMAKKSHDALPMRMQRFLNENRYIVLLKKWGRAMWRLIALFFTSLFKLITRIFSKITPNRFWISSGYAIVISAARSGSRILFKPVDYAIKSAGWASLYILKKTIYWFLVVMILSGFAIFFAYRLLIDTTDRLTLKA
jgi:hypothetical protein